MVKEENQQNFQKLKTMNQIVIKQELNLIDRYRDKNKFHQRCYSFMPPIRKMAIIFQSSYLEHP